MNDFANIQCIPTPAMWVAPRPVLPKPVARIAKVTLSDYRAFPSGPPCEVDLGAEGRNLLLYGENGSGKSSLARALRDLCNFRVPPSRIEDSRHLFGPTAGTPDCLVSVKFTAGSVTDFSWVQGELHPSADGGQPYQAFARGCMFLDYRDLLETNFRHDGTPNLFHCLMKTVLDGLPVLAGGRSHRLGDLLRTVQSSIPVGESEEELERITAACTEFANALTSHLPDVVAAAQEVFGKLGHPGTEFNLEPRLVAYDRTTRALTPLRIDFSVKHYGHHIAVPQHFLNEARLTALALALYLGAAKVSVISDVAGSNTARFARLLVLDDVLIGLDLANRLPLLRVLAEDFADWQIILFTHDRVWFELAKEHTENTGTWAAKELCSMETGHALPPRPVIKDSIDLVDRAKAHLDATPPDLMAAAVYLRAAFETRLRNVCEKQGVRVPFKCQLKDIKADVLWAGIVDRQRERAEQQQRSPGNQIPDFIPATLVADVETMRSTILNRLSHTGAPTLVKSEIEFALRTVRTLQGHSFPKVSTVHP